MNPRQALRWIVLMFVFMLVWISWRDYRKLGYPPPPARYTASVGLYGLFGLGSEFAPEFAAVLALAYTVGALVASGSAIQKATVEGLEKERVTT